MTIEVSTPLAEVPGEVTPNITVGGEVDNYPAIQAAWEKLGAPGGVVRLPHGAIGTSQEIVPPEGVYLVALGRARIGYPSGPYLGTVLVGTPGSKLEHVVRLSNPASGCRGIGVNSHPGEGADAILLDANGLLLERVRAIGNTGNTAINATSNATEAELLNVRARGYGGSSAPALICKGSDWTCVDVWTTGPTRMEGSGGIWNGCHFVCNASNGGPNLKISGQQTLSGSYIDGSAETCLIEITGGNSSFAGCRYYQNAGVSGIPIFKTGGISTVITGGIVIANGASNEFSYLADKATNLNLTGLTMETGAVAALFGENTPKHMSGVVLNGTLQARYSGAPQTVVNGTTSGTAIWSMPEQGPNYKKIIVYLNAYKNAAAEAQKIVFPVEFQLKPIFLATNQTAPGSGHAITGPWAAEPLTKKELILPKEMSGPVTDWLFVEGY